MIIINTPFTFRDVTDSFPDFLEVSSLIVCQVFLELTLYSLELLQNMKDGHTRLSHHQICLNSDSRKDTPLQAQK